MKVSLKRKDRNQGNSRFWRIQKLIRCIFSEPQRFLKRLCIVSGTVLALGAGVALAAPGDPTGVWNLQGQDHYSASVHDIELTDYIGTDPQTIYADSIINAARFSEPNASMYIDQGHSFTGLEADSSLLMNYVVNAGTIENLTAITITDWLENNVDAVVSGNGAGSTLTVEGALTNSGNISEFTDVTADSIDNNDTYAYIGGTGAGSTLSASDIVNAGGIGSFSSVTSSGDIENSDTSAYIRGTGSDSTLLALGKLTNSGDISSFDSVKALGHSGGVSIENSGILAGAGAGARLIADGNLENTKTIGNFAHVEGDNIDNDGEDAVMTGTGAGSALSAKADLTNSGTIKNYAAVSAGNDLTNDNIISGAGAGSTLTAWNNLTNNGDIQGFTVVAADNGNLTNNSLIVGEGAAAALSAGAQLANNGSVENFAGVTAEKITNAASAAITGAGIGSSISSASDLTNDGAVGGFSVVAAADNITNAAIGTITGNGADSSLSAGGTLDNAGVVSQFAHISADKVANAAGAAISGVGIGSALTSGTDIDNSGDILGFSNVSAVGDITNAADAAITGNGADSNLSAGGTLDNAGSVTGFANVSAGELKNSADAKLTGTGRYSTLKTGSDLTTEGTISGFSDVEVAGTLTNEAEGKLIGTGPNSNLTAEAVRNDGSGRISGFSAIETAGDADNGADASIEGTGAGSTFTVGGNLTTDGTISQIESLLVDDTITNGGYITGTGANSKVAANSLKNSFGASVSGYSDAEFYFVNNGGSIEDVEQLIVKNDITNDGAITGTGDESKLKAANLTNNIDGTIDGFAAMNVAGIVNNKGGITASGEDSTYKIGELNNDGTIDNVEAMVVTGDVANNGDINGTGDNSKFTAANLDNSADASITGYSNMTVAGIVNNDGQITSTGEDSTYKLGVLNNNGAIDDVEAMVVTGDAVNNGEINGTGANSKFTANALDNNGSGEIRDFSDMDVTGAVNNAADAKITATGPNSTYKMGELNNHGEVADIEALIVNGNVNNFDDGRIIGSGSNSRLDADNLNNNNEGCVEDFSDMNIAGNVFNAVKATIEATGENSSYKIGGRLDNYGVVNNIEALTVDGDINNYGDGTYNGLIIGTGANSKINAANLNNNTYGIVHKFSDMDVTGKVFNADQATISGSGANSAYKMGTLENHGVIGGVEAITVAGGATNDGSGIIVGTGDNSKFDADTLDNLGSGRIWSFSDMNVTGPVNNAADAAIVATGEGSSYKMGELNNGGLVAEAESVTVSGNINNYGDGTIVGTGDNSKLAAENLYNNDTAAVIDYSNVNVSGQVVNAADALIRGAGESSSFKAGELDNSGLLDSVEEIDVEGTITNRENGSILEVGANSTLKAGNITNNGVISATADPDADTSVGIYSSMDVDGDLVNAGPDPDQSLTQWKAAAHPNAEGQDDRENKRPDTPAMQTLAEDLSGAAKIVNYSNMSVGGTLTNAASGYIRATGVGSTYTLGTLDNSGVLTGVENLNVANNLTNLGGGLIQGTGVGSTLNVGGNLDINFGSTIRHYETVNVGGDLNNLGAMEFISDTYVGGSFLNQSNTYVPRSRMLMASPDAGGIENASGGMLVTDTYNGRIGKITVQGDAVINGGELWIGGSGEQLRVGQDYVFLTVNDGHLTVNEALKIRASNEYDYDTLLDDNYDTGSSNKTKSATPRLFHAEGFYNDTDYYVSLRRDFVYGRTGVTSNQKNVGTYLDSLAYTLNSANDNYSEGDLFNVLSALDNENINGGNVPDSDYGYSNGKGEYTYVSNYATEGALKALDQLSGAIYADMAMMSRQNLWIVQNHLADFLRPDFCLECNCACGPINNGCGCGCDAAGFCTACEDTLGDCVTGAGHNFWGMYYGNFGEIESDGNAGDFDYKTNGFIIGGDLYRSHRTRVGIYGAYGYTSLDRNGLDNSSKTQSYNVGLYGVHEFCFGNLLGTAGITRDNFKADRLLHFGESPLNSNYVHRMHHGELQSTQYNVRLEQSWNYALRRTLFQPVIGVAYDHLRMSDLQESTEWGDREDGQYVTELHSDGYNLDSLRSDIGLRLSRCCTHGSSAFSLQGRAAWIHEFADTNVEITNSFTNRNYDVEETGYGNAYNTEANNAFNSDQFNTCSYTIRGVDLGRDYAWGGAGLTYTCLNSNISLFAAYDILFNDLERLHNVSGGAEFSW